MENTKWLRGQEADTEHQRGTAHGSGGRVMSQSRKAPRSLDHRVPKQSPYFTVAEKTCGSLDRFLK